MKAQILKMSGCKTQKEFYKKYPSEEAFMKVHGKEFKKAQMGTMISGGVGQTSNPKMINLQNMYDEADMDVTGMTDEMRQKQAAAYQAAQAPAPSKGGGGGGDMLGSIMGMLGKAGGSGGGDMSGIASALARYGADIPRAQVGANMPSWYQDNPAAMQTNYQQAQPTQIGPNQKFPKPTPNIDFETPSVNGYPRQGFTDQELVNQGAQITGDTTNAAKGGGKGIMDTIAEKAGPVGQLYGSYQALRGERRARKAAEQQKAVSDITLKASQTRPEQIQRKYVRPEDIQNTGEEFFPIYGVGTNPLARNGIRLQDGGGVEDRPGGMMGREAIIPEVDAVTPIQEKPSNFDSNSARDNWVQKTGLPWSEAKRLGYTSGTAKDNTKLLGELNDPRFKKENLRSAPPKNSSKSRTPIQHRETPTGKLAPITSNSLAAYDKAVGKRGNEGYIRAAEEQNPITRVGEVLANPFQSFAEYAKYGELPAQGFSRHDKSVYDQAVGIVNPLYWANALSNAAEYASQGQYGKAATESLDALPALSKLKYVKNIPFAKGLPPASVRRAGYLGEGAKRIGAAPAKQLTGNAAKQIAPSYVPNFTMYEDGGRVGGNPTEIQNTYAPNTLFDDLGYESLNDSNQVKSFYHGGRLHSMQDGGNFDWAAAGNLGTNVADQATGNNAGGDIGGQLGGTAGEAIGNAILPGIGGKIGKEIGQVGGTLAGGFLDTNPKAIKRNQAATKRNIQTMALNSGFQGIQGQNVSYMEDGGYVSHDWQPQVIATFGEHKMSDLLRPPHDADMLRAGGHLQSYTPPSERAMQTYDDGGEIQSYGLGGELQTHWGGGAETISHNPYLPGTGETVMFRGKSHEEYSPNGETGIGVTYGGNPVEVERGEPMVELEEGGTIDPETGEVQKSGVVFGNLKIPNQYLDLLGDKSAKGKKFKNYVNDLSKGEERQNKIIEKSTNELNDFTPITPFDKLKMTSLQANLQGANMKLKEYADKKINAAALQNAINDTAEEHGLVADDLAKGKVKQDKEAMKQQAKFGGKFTKAQDGTSKYGLSPWQGNKTGLGKKTASEFSTTDWDEVADKLGFKGKGNKEFEEFLLNDPEAKKIIEARHQNLYGKGAYMDPEHLGAGWAAPELKTLKQKGLQTTGLATTTTPTTPSTLPNTLPTENKANWMDILNTAIPYLRPSDQETLDMEQLYPEMYAMSSNQLEPVPAQGYQPDLGVPYDVSFQDQLNANQADYRAAQRISGYNPAAQANLNAQKYQANQQVLGNQFRANQEMKDKVYGENRNILNQAKLTNLGIYDKQYERQAQALSNTKATTQAALNSIADKFAKNKLENKTLGVYENMYNYRYDDKGRAINMNPLAKFNTQVGGSGVGSKSSGKGLAEGKRFLYDENGNIADIRPMTKEEKEKNGKSIKAKNGSIVRSYKNI